MVDGKPLALLDAGGAQLVQGVLGSAEPFGDLVPCGLRIPAGGDGGADSFGATGGGFVRGNSFPSLSLDTFGLGPDRHGSLVSLLSSDGGGMRLGEGFPAKLIRRIARRAGIPSGAQLTPQFDRAKAGLTLLHSSGKVEGHVNRVKMLKRQMYSQANPDLLPPSVTFRSLVPRDPVCACRSVGTVPG